MVGCKRRGRDRRNFDRVLRRGFDRVLRRGFDRVLRRGFDWVSLPPEGASAEFLEGSDLLLRVIGIFLLKLRPGGVVFVVFLGAEEDEGGPLDSLVK
jgi:hypothetical protein